MRNFTKKRRELNISRIQENAHIFVPEFTILENVSKIIFITETLQSIRG